MASFWMAVCLPAPVVNVPAAISDALKPFKLGREGVSVDRWQWDRWRISCGDGDGGFRIADGFDRYFALIRPDDGCALGWCAGGPRFALALDREWHGGALTLDGWWWFPGEPPVHGACASRADCVHSPEVRDVDDCLRGLPHDTVIVALICHG